MLEQIKLKVLSGDDITREDALTLVQIDLDILCSAADDIRKAFCGNNFEICTIVNAKSGRCSENCKFCAQSAHYDTSVDTYPLMDPDDILQIAQKDDQAGVQRFAPVTSGRKLSNEDLKSLCISIKAIKENTNLKVCASCGLLTSDDFKKLKEARLSRYHNNLETSEKFFKTVCSTHSTEDKVNTIKFAKEHGLEICSGGIMGLGESWEDRIDMALQIRKLGVVSIPINMLSPIVGTPFEHNKVLDVNEMRRICAIYRFINPKVFIRLAGGRWLLADKGRSCFKSGANAVISGDMLTTVGITVKSDLQMIKELGYKIVKN